MNMNFAKCKFITIIILLIFLLTILVIQFHSANKKNYADEGIITFSLSFHNEYNIQDEWKYNIQNDGEIWCYYFNIKSKKIDKYKCDNNNKDYVNNELIKIISSDKLDNVNLSSLPYYRLSYNDHKSKLENVKFLRLSSSESDKELNQEKYKLLQELLKFLDHIDYKQLWKYQ